jgi:hypothetical protein
VRETGAPDDHAAAESLTPEVMVTVVADPSEEVARASTTQVTALVLSSLHWSVSPPVVLGTSSQRLDEDVIREFDATHHLLELITAWGILAAIAASFGGKL